MPRKQVKLQGKATIDVCMVLMKTGALESGTDYALDTASKVAVEPQVETQDGVKVVKLGVLLAQKLPQTTITGHKITLTDNVFYPEIMKVLQGGKVTPSMSDGVSETYTPPVAGSAEKGEIFDLECYSAVYDASGAITMYEKTLFPNCQGSPVPINREDNVFSIPEYVIYSAPKKGQAPYTISYVKQLPEIAGAMAASATDETMQANVLEDHGSGIVKR